MIQIRKPGDLPADEHCNRTGCSGVRFCALSGPPCRQASSFIKRARDDVTGSDNSGETAPTELLICVKCRGTQEVPDDARRPGRALYDAVAEAGVPPQIRLRAVECLQNCDSGCSVALRGGNRWSYVYGRLDTTDADMLIEGATLYDAAVDGLIPWRQRPEHFKRNCVARIPPLTFPDLDLEADQ